VFRDISTPKSDVTVR